jgi:hypothetical protein
MKFNRNDKAYIAQCCLEHVNRHFYDEPRDGMIDLFLKIVQANRSDYYEDYDISDNAFLFGSIINEWNLDNREHESYIIRHLNLTFRL